MAATQDGNTPLHALLIHMLRNEDNGNIKPGHIETLKTLVSQRAPFLTANVGSSFLAGSDKFRPHYGDNVCN
ncbi:hypothetical protein [Anaplasma phagocytophilum]|uniref:hypothetical protein n=1 Tax=Anaplasma phagocytophilum TaxID=948 RepID=UPI0015DEA67E|nr:hypothetical protein [Anaplasma phagocytophilum]